MIFTDFDFWILDFLVLLYFILFSSFDFFLFFELFIYKIITGPFW